MTTEYNNLLKSPNWFEKRNIILVRDKNQCQCCGSISNLHIHHRQYHADIKTGEMKLPWDYDNKYLITLCENCHSTGHSKYKVPTFNI